MMIGTGNRTIRKKHVPVSLLSTTNPTSWPDAVGSQNLGYILAWFQYLQLPSTQSESPLALIPLAPKSHVSFKVGNQLYFDPDYPTSGLTVTGLARVYCN
jgi:hypothetical protein